MPAFANRKPLPDEPSLSVIIISRNEGRELEATVNNLLEATPPERLELIVVDDGSTDGSTAFLDGLPSVRVLRSERIGVAKARNLGAAHATRDVILFADAHVRAPAGWHIPVLEALRNESVGAVAPGVYDLNEPRRRGFGLELTGPEMHARWRHRKSAHPYAAPVLPGCFLAMRRDVFLQTGAFDSGMHQLGGNDNELSCRFWLLGYELLVIPEVEVGHLFRTTTPYEPNWAAVVHNRLRMALVHFSAGRVERVISALRSYEAFPKAMAMMLESDVFARRAEISASRRFNDDWYFQKFELVC